MSLQSLQALESVIDHDALLMRCLNKIDFAERMLALFQERCIEEMSDLVGAVERRDLEAVRKIAHRMSGACANAAAFGLQSRVTELRKAADGGSIDEVVERMDALELEWDRFTAAVTASDSLDTTEASK
jgi:HPt (histidine-containing phosphotransfer) domain-containing protein